MAALCLEIAMFQSYYDAEVTDCRELFHVEFTDPRFGDTSLLQ
jgi:hypothetical protein